MNDEKAFSHEHDFLGSDHDENAKRTFWVVLLTFVMMAVEITAGYLTGSMALLADGFHMATHAAALGIAAAAYAYAKRNVSNRRFSFGTGKVGDLSGFASALILALASLGIAVESAIRLLHPADVQFDTATLIAVVGLLVNVVSALLLSHGHNHEHEHEHGDSTHAHGIDNNLRSAYVHVMADALTSLLAIAALLAGRYLGWVWLDPAMGIVGAIVIARWAWDLMRSTASVLLDHTNNQIAEEIQELVERTDEATLVDLHVWRVGPDAHAAILSVVARSTISTDSIRDRLRPVHEISHLTVEVRNITAG